MKFPILPALALLSTPAFAVVNIDYVSVGNAGIAATVWLPSENG
jgi:hypothetical protein